MKKIINNKVYDTETAQELASWANTWDTRDFHHVCETLYRKRTGEFFLCGEGGPMTQYARTIGQNEWLGGEKIFPLSAENARKWAEEHLDADDYIELFGEPKESPDERVTLCVQIPADLDTLIRRQAAERGISLSAYINDALAKAVK